MSFSLPFCPPRYLASTSSRTGFSSPTARIIEFASSRSRAFKRQEQKAKDVPRTSLVLEPAEYQTPALTPSSSRAFQREEQKVQGVRIYLLSF